MAESDRVGHEVLWSLCAYPCTPRTQRGNERVGEEVVETGDMAEAALPKRGTVGSAPSQLTYS